jgi:hypothetical protein
MLVPTRAALILATRNPIFSQRQTLFYQQDVQEYWLMTSFFGIHCDSA